MQKDYYHILQVSPNAPVEDIKRAFRRLALKYHPDVLGAENNSNQLFAEIYEAYQVLTDPVLSRDYLLHRHQAYGQYVKPTPVSMEELLTLTIALHGKILKADPFRIDRDLLQYEILYLLSQRNLQILQNSSDMPANDQFIRTITGMAPALSYSAVKQIAVVLKKACPSGSASARQIDQFVQNSRRNYYWNKYKALIALLIALAICLLIYFSR